MDVSLLKLPSRLLARNPYPLAPLLHAQTYMQAFDLVLDGVQRDVRDTDSLPSLVNKMQAEIIPISDCSMPDFGADVDSDRLKDWRQWCVAW